MSESFLTNYLKKQVNLGFKEFVNSLLVNKAVEYLRLTDMSITEIAYESGFGSLRSMNRVFYTYMGCTPKQFRKKL